MMNFAKNRAFALLAALLCVCLLLVACGDGQGENEDHGDVTTEPAEDVTAVESGSESATGGDETAEGTAETESLPESETESDTEPAPETVTYTVSVIGSDGNARQGATVRFVKNGEQVGTAVTAAGGVATAELLPDTYDVEIANLFGETYSKQNCTVTPDSTALTVTLYGLPTAGEEIYAYSETVGDHKAYVPYNISEGSYMISPSAEDMTYYLFVSSRGGTFKLSLDKELPISIGYYGSTSFVLTESIVPEQDNAILVDVYDDMVYNYAFVIGICTEDASVGECVLRVEYVSERETTESDVPWTDLMPERELEQYVLGPGTVTDFAVDGAKIELVFSEKDGYYHVGSEDGPVVLVNLNNNSQYMDALTTVCGNMRLGVYVYDEDGKLLSKDSYNELIWAYNEKSDGGYYPLDDTLLNMLKVVGDYMGWYSPSSPMYLFSGVALEPANAYLFACVYLQQ